jgi:hypothetical protein
MEKTIRVFRDHEEARRFNRAEIQKMSPDERVQLALDLHQWYYQNDPAAAQGLARVYRVVQREQC